MKSNWKEIRLGDVAEIKGGKRLPKGKQLSSIPNNHPYIKVKNMGQQKVLQLNSEYEYVDDETQKSISRYIVSTGDILISVVGTVGLVSIVGETLNNANQTENCDKITNLREIDADYLYYYLISPLGQEEIHKGTVGAVQAKLPLKNIQDFSIICPDLIEQKKVANVLSIIDEKIACNERINDNLAEQAQAFLGHFMEQYQYQLKPLSDIADVIDCLHSKKPAAVDNSSYQLIQLDNIRDDGFLDMSACKYMISQADYENWTRKCEIIEGDCVITNVGRIGAVSQAPFGTKAAMGRNMTCIRLKSGQKLHAYFITVLLSNHMRRQIQHNTDEGTIMGALNVKNIPKLLFPIFDSSNMSELENILYPLRKQIEYNNLQNQSLSQLRDTLLPKLMSGELDVSELAF